MDVLRRNNVIVSGKGARTIIFSHGFGCDQSAWRDVAPAFEADWRVVLFDHIGAGGSDVTAYEPIKYASLSGYAQDVLQVMTALELEDTVFVGHSVAAMIGMLAAIEQPRRFGFLVMLCPSPCYINDSRYIGGFGRKDIDCLLETLGRDSSVWWQKTTPAIIGAPERPELGNMLADSFSRTDPEIARRFARAIFLSDHRADLPKLRIPALVLQTREDMVAPVSVGEYMADHVQDSTYTMMQATGHYPHMSAPAETIAVIRDFLVA
jgi:sigma-B regulation protein RsbQ